MSIFKCKMCGGTIEFEQGATVGVCDSCGTKQTLPRLDDDRRANLYDRANHFRRNNDFDKAAGIYEQILTEDTTDAEAYWSLVLCRYGIEYVEDPATHKRVPTVNRAQFTSIFDDDNYKSALQYADGYQRKIYEEEANAINEIQKGILAISQKEEPFDVFICYKETDNNGRRTPDSVLANDLYHQLTQEGFKVFFARITLEDKLGTAYEPYIFAALNSSKVMVVLGTKPEHFNAVWVKNEWSRYLALVKKSGGKKILIPAYKDMDPYDLPEEFSHLQAQDMSKLGFMQDLIRGIKKIATTDEPKVPVKETVVVSSGSNANIAPLLERAFLFLEDEKWQDADIYCEKVLDIDPKNAEAYLGKLMAELQVKNRKQLTLCDKPFDDRDNYVKVLRFGDEKLETEIRGYIADIKEFNSRPQFEDYKDAVEAMNKADDGLAYKMAEKAFKKIPGFKDADSLAEQCHEKAEIWRKDSMYSMACSLMAGNFACDYKAAVRIFGGIPGWKDADERIKVCQKKYDEKIDEEIDAMAMAAIKDCENKIAKLQKLKDERQNANERIQALQQERSTLGLFSGKRKHEVDKEIEKYLAIKNSCDEREKSLANNLTGFQTKESIEARIGQIEAYVTELKSRLNQSKVVFSYSQAFILYNTEDYRECFEKKYPTIEGLFCFTFGHYIQKPNGAPTPIEWIPLDEKDGKLLLVSKYALDCQPYNSSLAEVTWETCSLRKWLNETFINKAFSIEERRRILSTTVITDKNLKYSTSPSVNTIDKVFLLSIAEVKKYFTSTIVKRCCLTEYAEAQRAIKNNKKINPLNLSTLALWLRSHGSSYASASIVFDTGTVYDIGTIVSIDIYGVRPAMWINLGS